MRLNARLTHWSSAAFVPLWSSGILFGAMALRHGPPFAITALRFVCATLLLAMLALLRGTPWPRGTILFHAAMVGLLMQGLHYGAIYAGLHAGMPAGVAALVVGLIPVATAIGAVPLLGEAFTRRRLAAAVLGGAAALLVVWTKMKIDSGPAMVFGGLALAGGAGAALWQKRFGVGGASLSAAAVQLAVGTVVMGLCWLVLERGQGTSIEFGLPFLVPFTWTVIANSVGATLLLLWLLDRGAAGQVTGLFFLVPPVTALTALPLLGEQPSLPLLLAIALGVGAVRLLATEKPR